MRFDKFKSPQKGESYHDYFSKTQQMNLKCLNFLLERAEAFLFKGLPSLC